MVQEEKNRIYFASDFHLGVPDFETSLKREKQICAWLDSIRETATEIFLVGDVFDFWFEYRYVVPKGYVRLLGKLAEICDSGTAVYFFKGNHDMWTFSYLEREIGMKVISDELIIQRNAKTFFIHHGDGLGPGDKTYKFIRKIFRSRICIALFAFLHPSIGFSLAKYLSARSRIQNGENDKRYLGDENEYIVRFCRDMLRHTHYDYFICGHRHFPVSMSLNEKSLYVNLGEWVNDFTFAEFDGIHLELKTYKP